MRQRAELHALKAAAAAISPRDAIPGCASLTLGLIGPGRVGRVADENFQHHLTAAQAWLQGEEART